MYTCPKMTARCSSCHTNGIPDSLAYGHVRLAQDLFENILWFDIRFSERCTISQTGLADNSFWSTCQKLVSGTGPVKDGFSTSLVSPLVSVVPILWTLSLLWIAQNRILEFTEVFGLVFHSLHLVWLSIQCLLRVKGTLGLHLLSAALLQVHRHLKLKIFIVILGSWFPN